MSYPDYRTFLRYKNCCRPIGDTGPPGPAGPTGPAATLDVPGNKGEILYFSENDNLDSTNTIFITNGNVNINNNLVVSGNLSMNDQFINDVSGIYFSDGTYIGHGSSFDIKTKQLLDINATGGISVTGNLTVNDATTVNKTLDIIGNTTLENLIINGSINNIIEITGNTIQPIISESVNLGYDEPVTGSNDKRFNLGFFNRIKTRTAIIVGNLEMENSSITGVDNITSNNNLNIQASDGVIIRGNLNVDDATTFKSDTTINANLTINAATTIRSSLDLSGNLSMNKNSIKDVDTIYFSENGSSNQTYIDFIFSELRMKSQGSIKFLSEDIPNATLSSEIDIAILNNNNLRFNNDNTYITSNTVDDKLRLYGNSIFMAAGVNGDFTFTGNSNNVDLNFLTKSATGFTINYKDSDDKLRFNNNDLVIDKTNSYIGIQTDSPSATLEVNGNAIINGNLSMNDNIIDQINFIQFTDINGKIYSPLQRNALLFYDSINTNSSYQNCVYSYTDSVNNGLISSQIFNNLTNKITFSNAVLNTFNYATFSVSCSGLLIGGAKNDIIFDVFASSGKSVTNFPIDTRSISGNGSVTFGPVTYRVTDNLSFTKSIFYNNTYDLRVKSSGSSQYTLSDIKLSVNLI